MVVSDYYYSLDENSKKKFRDMVIDEIGIAYATFYYKLKNNNWRKSELHIIDNIINTFNHITL